MPRTVRAIAIATVTAVASLSLQTSAHAATAVTGTYDYFWELGFNSASGILSDSATYKFSRITSSYTLDISSVATNDVVDFTLAAQKSPSGTALTPSSTMVISASIDGTAIDPMSLMGAPDLYLQKQAGDHLVTVKLSQSEAAFDSSAGKAGTLGKVQILPSYQIIHMVGDSSDPTSMTEGTSELAVAVTAASSGVTNLKNVFIMDRHTKAVTLPANVVSAFADVEWNSSVTLAKATTVSASKLTATIKAPTATTAKALSFTWCSTANNFCSALAANKNRGYYTFNASNTAETAYQDSGSGISLKLKWATKKVYVSQGIAVNSTTTAGTVLTMNAITVTK